jgi:hypothetical protein
MASLLLPLENKTAALARACPKAQTDGLFVVAGCGDPRLADFANFVECRGKQTVTVTSTDSLTSLKSAYTECPVAAIVVFLGRRESPEEKALLELIQAIASEKNVATVCAVSSFSVHLGDQHATEAEARALKLLEPVEVRKILFRPGHTLSPNSRVSAFLRSWWFCYPLLPRTLTSCFVPGDELFAAIEQELIHPGQARERVYTLLGANQPWRTLLKNHRVAGVFQPALALACSALALLGVGWLVGLFVNLFNKSILSLRHWNFNTLYPRSKKELLALYNKYNHRHVKIVGYNNGVVHFGQKHPGKTIVSTVRCNGLSRLHGSIATFDAGVTLRDAIDSLKIAGKEFHVLPNYSYVSVGTAFFVPIHGSASVYSTMGQTIDRVLLYDPVKERFVRATPNDPPFGQFLYNLNSDVLLLRLSFRVKDKGQYYRLQSRLENPTSQAIVTALSDRQACNVEIRKSRGNARFVDVSKYYEAPPRGIQALEFPRDSLGRMWDKLEANPLSSFVFHGLTRRFAHHVELFFTAEEFARFWNTHTSLPIAKIQLRNIQRDGFPHSPFFQHDCISADMFMLRKHKRIFESYLKENFRAVRFNPGKHSM